MTPWILGFMAILATACFFGDKYDKRKKAALRGATRIA